MVASMRNGVLAVTRDGAIAVMNDEAYRIFGLAPDPADIGRAYADVLRDAPRHRPRDRERVRAEPPAESRRAAAEVDRAR